jgi:transposase
MNYINNQKKITVGVDTGKLQLDINIRPLDIYFKVTNDEKDIKKAIKQIKPHKPTPIVIEATVRLEHPFIIACSQTGLPLP